MIAATVPNRSPTPWTASAQPATTFLTCIGVGIGGEVEVLVGPVQQGVSQRATDQEELVTGGVETSSQLDGGRARLDQPAETRGDGHPGP